MSAKATAGQGSQGIPWEYGLYPIYFVGAIILVSGAWIHDHPWRATTYGVTLAVGIFCGHVWW
jgi:hypothetical protein